MLISAISLALFLFFAETSFATTIVLDGPSQDCLNAKRVVNLSWTSDISGIPTFYVLRKLASEINYSEIGNTGTLAYTDNTALSDKAYRYKIKAVKAGDVFSNEITNEANYCTTVFSTTEASCKANGPHDSLTWVAATGNILKYEILRKNNTAGEVEFTKIGETTDHAYDDGPNIIGTNSYSYTIRTVWQDGTKKDSENVPIEALTCPVILNSNTSCYSSLPGGQKIDLSWNGLMGAIRYEIYRKAQSDLDYSLLSTVDPALTTYTDNLVESMPLGYWKSGNINYLIKTVWLKDAEEITKDSAPKQIVNYNCKPFMSTSGMCDASGNPEMHLNWTKTLNSDFYNLYRDDATFLGQYGSGTNSLIDYLSPADCSDPSIGICSHDYKVVSIVTGFPNFISNTASQYVDCATIVPPSPTPVIDTPEIFCDNADSRIRLSWTPSENVIYYTLYRNGAPLLNLTNTSYIDSGIEAGAEYTYYVIANGRKGTQTAPSLTQSANASECIPPSIPDFSMTKSCVLGNPKISLSWSATSYTMNYEIKKGLSEPGILTAAVVNNSDYFWSETEVVLNNRTNQWSDADGLSPSTTYYYQVVANGIPGTTPGYSTVQSITTDSCLPTLPVVSLANVCFGGNPKVTVSWTSDDVNTQNYKVYREDIALPIATVLVGGTYSIVDPNPLLGSTIYKYKVVAVGYNSGQERSSSYLPVTTNNCLLPGPFTLTDPPTASCQDAYPKVQLDWTSSANATSYNLFRSVSSPATVSGVTSPYNDIGHGKMLNFDGSNDYAKTDAFSISNPGNALTVSAWVYNSKKANNQTIIADGSQSGSVGYLFLYRLINADSLIWQFANGTSYVSLSSSSSFFTGYDNKWVLVTVVVDYAGKNAKFYRNNVLVNTATTTNAMLYPTASRVKYIGSYNSSMHFFNGSIDEVRIYNRSLSLAEVGDIYNGTNISELNLVSLWHFDEGAGQIASDSSNGGVNTTLGSTMAVESIDPSWGNNILSSTSYSWKVDAISAGGSVSSNTTAPLATLECPPQRSNLVLAPQCSSNKSVVNLSWPYSMDASTYEIYRGGVLVQTAGQSIDPNVRKWTDDNAGAGLSDLSNYTYNIKSISSGGLSSQSADRIVTTKSCAVLPIPTGLSASFSCSGTPASTPKATLNWNAVTGATSYDIYRNGLFLINKTVLSHEDTTITVNTLYDYTVRAKNAGGVSSDSGIASISLGKYCTPQKPVVNLSAGCSGGNPANNINWTGETYPNTIAYKIYRGAINNFADAGTNLIGTIDKATQPAAFAARTLIDNPSSPRLADEATYYYWVEAIGPAPTNYTTLSDGTNVLNLFCGPPESTNTLVGLFLCSGAPPSSPYAYLSWYAIGHATSYDLYRNGAFLINVTALTYNDSTISVNTAYDYTVRGRSPYGQGPDSNVISIGTGNYCTPSVPAISPITTICASNQSKNSFSWTDATSFNTDKFEIYRSTDSTTISNFESITFMPPGWLTGGNANWFRDVTVSSEGAASAASGAIGNNQSTFIDYDITVSNMSVLRFYWKISSENGWDFLLFCLDNDGCTRTSGYINRISGTSMTSFAEVVVPISAGTHSFHWVYAKNGGWVGGSDKGWIDNVRIVSIDSAALLQTVNKNILSFADSDSLPPLTDYIYWIKAIGPTGLSSFSASSVRTLSCGILPPVTNLNASFGCTGPNPYADLTWDAVPDATSYNIYRDGPYLTSRTTNYYNDIGIDVNTAYSYTVRAENDAGEGLSDSNVASIGLGNYCAPSVPVIDPIVSNCSSEKPINAISWSDDFPSGTKKYEVYRNVIDNLGSALLVRTLDKTIPADLPEFNSREWTDSSVELLNLQAYYYWIKSVGPTGLSSSSNSMSVTTLFCGVPAASVLSLGGIYCDLNKPYADLSWTSSLNAYSYNLSRDNVTDSVQSAYPTVRSPITDSGSKSLQFDGIDDYVNMRTRASFNVNKLTLALWIKTPSSMGGVVYRNLVSKQGADRDYNFYTYSSDGAKVTKLHFSSARWGSSSFDLPTPFMPDTWHHVAVTVSDSGLQRYYYDGNLLNQYSGIAASANSSYPLWIGKADNLWNGSVDEAYIYNRDLSGAEIADIYNGIYNNETGLVGAWHFDEKTGTNVIDGSGLNNSGTIVNGVARQNFDLPAVSNSLPLESSKNYKYTVRALGIGTESAPSNEIPITTPSCLPLPANSLNLTPSCDVSGSQIVLSWDPDPNTSYWTIHKKRTSQPDTAYTCINCPGTTLNSYTDLNIETNVSYDYYVEAYGSGVSAISAVKTATALVCFDIPNKPVINAGTGVCGLDVIITNIVLPKCAGSASRMEINWDSYDDSKTFSYNIFRKNITVGETDFTMIRENLPFMARNYIDGNINNAETYVYKIEAVGSGVDNSVESDPSFQTISCDCANIVPYYPPSLELVTSGYTLGSGGNIEIKWTDSENETYYQIFRKFPADSFAYIGNAERGKNLFELFINKASAADTYLSPITTMIAADNDYVDGAGYVSYNDPTVQEDETYDYRVIAYNDAGSSMSNMISAYVPIAPPGNFVLSHENLPNSVKLVWTAAAYSVKGGPPTYTVYKDSTIDFSSPEIVCEDVADGPPANPVNRKCIDSDISSGMAYYKVTATNNSPISTDSNIDLAVNSLKWDEIAP